MTFSNSLAVNKLLLFELFSIPTNFDCLAKEIKIGKQNGLLFCMQSFAMTEAIQNLVSNLAEASCDEVIPSLGFAWVETVSDTEDFTCAVAGGKYGVIIDGWTEGLLIDCNVSPQRSIKEPDSEKISRGSRDGFVEPLLSNLSLLRRRLKNRNLLFECLQVGTSSRLDVVIAYEKTKADKTLVESLKSDIASLQTDSLTMGAQSLGELLLPKKWWSPLPSFRMTERPDVACSFLEEGYVLLLVDNSPLALILPCNLFQFTQSPEDYCKPIISGTYSRWVRFLCIPINLLLLPLFLLLTVHYPDITANLSLLSTPMGKGRIIFYTFTAEFLLDLFKHSNALSDSRFSGTLSVVGGLIIGDMAISINWLSKEVLFYTGFTLLTSLSLPSAEFGDALRIYRMVILVFTAIFGLPGFIGGILFSLLNMAFTPVYGPYSYLWPLIPFDWKSLRSLLFRYPTCKKQPWRK